MGKRTGNDNAWGRLFSEYPIMMEVSKHGFYDIEAKDIREYREPRLMCKMDFRESIPNIFKENRLSILAISNRQYRIAQTDPFLDINESLLLTKNIDKVFSIPSYLESFSLHNITSESKALDAAKASGMLDFLFDSDVSYMTVRGRLYSQGFEFSLPDSKRRTIDYPIQSVQIEVDGGYEWRRGLALIEAKMGVYSNMNLRQLLYPQINFSLIMNKPVMTYLMLYETGGLFHFIPFLYEGKNFAFDYGNYKLFKLQFPQRINPREILETKIDNSLTGFGAPFPQADNFDRVMQIYLKIGELECATKSELFAEFDLVPRQWDYYLNALIWLGLVIKDSDSECYTLSEKGTSLLRKTEEERLFEIARIAFSNDIFNAFLHTDNPTITHASKVRNGLQTESTFSRRMGTVRRWKAYIFSKLKII